MRPWREFRIAPDVWLAVATGIAALATAYELKHLRKYQPFADIIGQQKVLAEFGIEADNTEIAGRSRGRLVWRLAANHVSLSSDQHVISATGIENAVLFDSGERPLIRVSAARADFADPFGLDQTTNFGTLTLFGRVTAHTISRLDDSQSGDVSAVRRPDGTSSPFASHLQAGNRANRAPSGVLSSSRELTISTERLTWSSLSGFVRAPGLVTLEYGHGTGVTEATDVTYYPKSRDLTVHRLTGTFRVAPQVK